MTSWTKQGQKCLSPEVLTFQIIPYPPRFAGKFDQKACFCKAPLHLKNVKELLFSPVLNSPEQQISVK